MKKQKTSRKEIVLAITIIVVLLLILGVVLIWRFVIVPSNSQIEEEEETQVLEQEKAQEVTVATIATKDELLIEVNKRRAEAGVAPLQYSPELEQSAQEKCDDMVTRNYYEHVDPDGVRGIDIIMTETGWHGYFDENLVGRPYQDAGANSVFDSWFDSAAHKKEALNPVYTLTGFGVCSKESDINVNSIYFVEHFYGP